MGALAATTVAAAVQHVKIHIRHPPYTRTRSIPIKYRIIISSVFFLVFASLDRLFRVFLLKSKTPARSADVRRHPAVGTAVLPYCCPHRRQPVSSVSRRHITAVKTTVCAFCKRFFFFFYFSCLLIPRVLSNLVPQKRALAVAAAQLGHATNFSRPSWKAVRRTPAGRPVMQRT